MNFLSFRSGEGAKIARELHETLIRFDLVNRSSSDGLWDMVYPADGNVGAQTPFIWTDRFRQLLGYANESDFPNVLGSWASLLHPDHEAATLTAFNARSRARRRTWTRFCRGRR